MRGLREYTKKKEGFTLMELIVVIVIVGILGAGVAALMAPAMNIYRASTDISQGKLIASSIASEIEGQLRYAINVQAEEERVEFTHPRYGQTEIVCEEGRLAIVAGGVDIAYDRKFYMDKEVAVTFEGGGDILTVTVSVSRDGTALATYTRPIKLINN